MKAVLANRGEIRTGAGVAQILVEHQRVLGVRLESGEEIKASTVVSAADPRRTLLGLVGAPECGDVMQLQIKVDPQTGMIEDAKFKCFGCGSAIASSSLATEWIKGKSLEQAEQIKNTQIAEELALPPVKIHCSILAEDAIKAAVADYRKKHGADADAKLAAD